MNAAFAIALILAATHNDPGYKKAPWIEVDGFAGNSQIIENSLPWEPDDLLITFHHLPKGTTISCFFVQQNVIHCIWEKPKP